ncbi:MAG: nucleotidyltransferase domain-containing protein [Clostridium sp.]|nr:nucleotidyltransferase domain-containing protein [Clostridium sp.]
MAKSVLELQNAFQLTLKKLKDNNKVLAIFTYGSIISGDVWKESDIDLFVVYDGEFNKVRQIYSKVLDVQINIRVLSKEEFLKACEGEEQDEYIKNVIIISRLAFSKDKEIIEFYNKFKYSFNSDRERYNLIYLGNFLKDFKVCKKYLELGRLNTSYEVLIRALDSFSKLFLNLNGYLVTKDSLTMATNLNDEFSKVINELFLGSLSKDLIKKTIDYIDNYLDENIKEASKMLLNYLEEKEKFISSYEIIEEKKFHKIKVEVILRELTKRGLVIEDKILLKDSNNNSILEEIVYAKKYIKRGNYG